MSVPDIKKYGLEFINDLSEDRKLAVQSLGVVFSEIKSELRNSKILGRSEEYQYIDDLMKHLRDEVNRNFESQLTRITIKSFNWIKNALMQGGFLVTDESREEELQSIINDLNKKLKNNSIEISEVQEKLKALDEEYLRKESELQGLRVTQFQKENDLKQELLAERKNVSLLSNQVDKLEDELFGFQQELEEKITKNNLLEDEITKLKMQNISQSKDIERLTNAVEQARRSITATDEDLTSAMQQWADSYQQQEEHFKKTMEDMKSQYEKMMQSKVKENSEKYDQELETLKGKLTDQDKQKKILQDQITELQLDKQDLAQRKEYLDSLLNELTDKNESILAELKSQKELYRKLQEEFKLAKIKYEEENLKEKLHLKDIQIAKAQNKVEWLEQCLSYSNFAPLTILLRMKNEMSLDDLAKSVGMDPIVLENQLQFLIKRDLIDVKTDGTVIAKIPSKFKE